MAIKAENVTINGTKLYGVHPATTCAGRDYPCVIHSPSDHHMRSWPIVLRSSRLIERTCPHGVGHPDPDSLAFFERRGQPELAVHGCDGCCLPPKWPQASSADRIVTGIRERLERSPYLMYYSNAIMRIVTHVVQLERDTDASYGQLRRTLDLKEQALTTAKAEAERYRRALAEANYLTAAEQRELADLRKMKQQLSLLGNILRDGVRY